MYNNKVRSRKDLSSIIGKIVFFSPIGMNIMYLSPGLRRDFLDEILNSTFEKYKDIVSEYKKILISRNKVLKNIRENKSSPSEIEFWDNKFALKASQIYNYRF
jgi:DNA replication and repair protein RecF